MPKKIPESESQIATGGQTYYLISSNSLSDKMCNSLLVVGGINHKYIVAGG